MRSLSRWLRVPPLRTVRNRRTPAVLLMLPLAVILLASGTRLMFARHAGSPETSTDPDRTGNSRRPFPELALDGGHVVEFVGMFLADTSYRPSSKLMRFAEKNSVPTERAFLQHEVPPGTLHSREYAVENFAPPRHAKSSPRLESPVRALFNNIATFAYGYQNTLRSPQNLTTDSQGRVIVVDAEIRAVHVIDPHHRSSFRILGGEGRRLALPGDVAVDGEDNIYIADYSQGLVLVYDPYGRFVGTIGRVHDENLFEQLSGIAIDRGRGYLYAADGPRHMLYMLDLKGAVVKRVGQAAEDVTPGQLRSRGNTGPHEFNYPTRILVGEREVLVLDTDGTRLRILDLNCRLIGGFTVQHAAQDHAAALGMDTDGRIYVLYSSTGEIRVYNHEGKVLTSFGQSGKRAGEFEAPAGMWIDRANRLYVSDTSNRRLQLFRLISDENAGAGHSSMQPSPQ